MNKRLTVFLVAIPGLMILGLVTRYCMPRAPTYQGKSAAAWFGEYARTMNTREETDRLNALRSFGPAVLPVLLKAMHARDSGPKRLALVVWPKLPAMVRSRLPSPIPAAQLRYRAYAVLAEMDPDSDEALRTLLNGLKDTSQAVQIQCARGLARVAQTSPEVDAALTAACNDPDPMVSAQALATLNCVGSNSAENRRLAQRVARTLPSVLSSYLPGIVSGELAWKSVRQLAKDLKRPNREYRYAATLALRERGLAAREALPVLIESLDDPYYLVQMGAVKTLGQLGSEAKAAAPALTRMLNQTTDEPLHRAILQALHCIEPISDPQVEKE
ncbi:MAG: hypothetical protein DME19_06660 [Verrucomicrobia bacterium]|nr:MAG: hypothetical protein DME19_06660 [Verrucomicrobiota bacterium]